MTLPQAARTQIVHRLAVAWAVVMLMLLAVAAAGLAYLRAEFVESGRHLVDSFARISVEQTEQIFKATDQRLQLIAHTLEEPAPHGTASAAAIRDTLAAQLKGLPELTGLWVMDTQGKIQYDTASGTVGMSLADRDFFKAHVNAPGTGLFIDVPVLSRRDARWQFTVSRAWRSADRTLRGVVVAAIDPGYLQAQWRSIDLGADGSVVLLRLDGTLLMRIPFEAGTIGKNFRNQPLFTAHLPTANNGSFLQRSPIDGIERTWAFRKLPERQMVLVVGTSHAFLLQPWYTIVRITAGVGVLVALVMAWLFAMLGRSWIQRSTTEAQALEQAHIDQSALAAISQGVVIADADRKTLSVNAAFETMTGYPRSEVIGKTCAFLQGPETDPATILAIRHALEGRRPFSGEILNYRKDGSQFWNALSINPIWGANGELANFVGVHSDVTAQRQHAQQLQLIEQVFSQSTEGITVTNARGNILRVNRAFTNITGYTEEEVLGKNPRVLQSGLQSQAYYQSMWCALLSDGVWSDEILNRNKDGTIYPEWLTISAIRNASGEVTHYLGSFSDLTHAKATETRIQRMSHFDPLTGLPNHTLMRDRTAHAISMVQRNKDPLCMMLVSIDHFKNINDTLGHHVGDGLLVETGKRLVASVRNQDTVSHQSGKEFLLILPGTPPEGAAHLATELLWTLAQPMHIGEHAVEVTASIGLASFPDNGGDFGSLYKSVEIALHRAQSSGRDNFKFYSDSMYQEVVERDSMTKSLRMAAERGELQVLYQPLADLQTGKISGMEALLRWHHPERGTISPAVFIPIAEESGLIRSIGAWVLGQVCKDIRNWLDKGIAMTPVAVNVSPLQLRDKEFLPTVQAVLASHQVDAGLIHLEVTESALMDDADRCEAMLRGLKALGFCLSLDDFGTGYSSLSYLKRYPFDKVKIDQSFVRDIGANQTDIVIVKVIISMAHGLGLRVIAEGVETEAQCEIMRSNVCDEIQGYFFSRPVDAATMESLLVDGCELPAHLLRFRKHQRTLLLVDDEPNVVSSLKRLLRRDGHTILSASSGAEGLELLQTNKVDVIISDQRMPGMTGVEFLREAKLRHPDTIRMVLSGYTELQSVTDAINEGAIYRFLTKPWDDAQLRDQVETAFQYKELLEENQQLDIKIRTTNQELVAANRHLGSLIQTTRQQIEAEATSLAVVQEALQFVPIPVMGLDDTDTIIFVNAAAEQMFGKRAPLLGCEVAQTLPELAAALAQADATGATVLTFDGQTYQVHGRAMGQHSRSRGRLLTLTHLETPV